jgi:hypothetical protein
MHEKWYWLVQWDNTRENPYVSGLGDLKGIEPEQLWEGKRIDNWDESAWLAPETVAGDGEPDDVLQNHLDLLIFSPRLQSGLSCAGIGGIQYCPIRIRRFDGSEIGGFAVANILNLVPALDLKKSDYDRFSRNYFAKENRGQIRAVRKGVLKGNAVLGLDIVRPAEYPVSVYVSEVFKRTFIAGNYTGFSFHEVKVC